MTTTLHRDWIESQHRHILAVIDGPNVDPLDTVTLPSGWTPLGMPGGARDASTEGAFPHLDAARELLDGGTYNYATGRVVRRASVDRLG